MNFVPTTSHSTIHESFRLLHDLTRKNPIQAGTTMTLGKKPVAAINEAKGFVERMGYRWQTNTDPDLLYDLLIFKPASIWLVKVRQTRYRIDPESFYEDLFPNELRGLRDLPFPACVLRELWLRTQHERIWRRLLVHELSVGELGWWGPGRVQKPARQVRTCFQRVL